MNHCPLNNDMLFSTWVIPLPPGSTPQAHPAKLDLGAVAVFFCHGEQQFLVSTSKS